MAWLVLWLWRTITFCANLLFLWLETPINRTALQSDNVIMDLATQDKQIVLLQVKASLRFTFLDLESPITSTPPHNYCPLGWFKKVSSEVAGPLMSLLTIENCFFFFYYILNPRLYKVFKREHFRSVANHSDCNSYCEMILWYTYVPLGINCNNCANPNFCKSAIISVLLIKILASESIQFNLFI